MNGNCIDIGTIQAFLDGELSPAAAAGVSTHLAGCDACSVLLATAEDESSLVFSVLEREMNSLVPTQRLWSRINDLISAERQNTPVWRKLLIALTTQLGNPSMAVAAGLVIVVGLFAAVWIERAPAPQPNAAEVADSRTIPAQPEPVTGPVRDVEPPADSLEGTRPVAVVLASDRPDRKRAFGGKTGSRPAASLAGYLPGEENYVKTISNLTQSVNSSKDEIMRPSDRVAYERDLAVVNDAISRLRTEVRKNPKNESAKQVLYTSYQNKIDLLNSVSQKEELMASLK